jgi:3(or 17)beta-hydroxysteroid dehydrogenase
MGRVEGKVVIVTGAAQNLGAAMAQHLAEQGAKVVITDIAVKEGRALAASLPGAIFLEHDVGDEPRWQQVVAETVERFGRLDALVNNAGNVVVADILQCTLEDFRLQERVNLEGTFLGCKHAIPAIAESGGGSIINMSALSARVGVGSLPAYSAVKAGIHGLTRSVALYCNNAANNIRCNVILAGSFSVGMAVNAPAHMREEPQVALTQSLPKGDPIDMAHFVLFLASDESRWINGQVLAIDRGRSVY